jgi:hypothetical protein
MEEPQVERRKLVTLPQVEYEAMLERAAERGARHALSEVGLDGPEAARDISELRSLLDAFNEAKKTAGLTIVRMLVTGLVMALLAGAFVKVKVFGGGQRDGKPRGTRQARVPGSEGGCGHLRRCRQEDPAGCEVRRETASIRSDASEARLRDSASIARRRRCLPKKAAENVLWVYAAALDAMCRPSRQLGTL